MHICIKTGCGRRGLKNERAISKYHEPDAKTRRDGKSKIQWFDEGSVLTGLGEGEMMPTRGGRLAESSLCSLLSSVCKLLLRALPTGGQLLCYIDDQSWSLS
jgi:hypothetical protein